MKFPRWLPDKENDMIEVIQVWGENFHRAAQWVDADGQWPAHWFDINTMEIAATMGDKVSSKFQTNDEWLAEDTVKKLDKGLS